MIIYEVNFIKILEETSRAGFLACCLREVAFNKFALPTIRSDHGVCTCTNVIYNADFVLNS